MPPNPLKGKEWANHRRIVNGILVRAPASIPLPDLTECFVPDPLEPLLRTELHKAG